MNNEITSYENGIDFDVEPLEEKNITIVEIEPTDFTEGQLLRFDDGSGKWEGHFIPEPFLIQSVTNSMLTINGDDSAPLVNVKHDGTIEFGPNYNPTDAARIFWQSIENACPQPGAFQDEVDVMDEHIRQMERLVATACSDGHYNFDEYLYGMANGLILSLAVMKNEEPQYLDRPERWLCESLDEKHNPLGAASEYGTQPECDESEHWVGECEEATEPSRCVSDEAWSMLGEIFGADSQPDEPDEEAAPEVSPWQEAVDHMADEMCQAIDQEIIDELIEEGEILSDYERAMKGM